MANPIIARELSTILRTRRMAIFKIGLICVFALLVIVRWPSDARMAASGVRSQEVFRLFAYGLLSAMLLLLPVFPATNIVREKIQGTLSLLLNSPLGPWRIYFGKLLGVLGLAGIVLCLSLPAAAACYASGGVSLRGELPGTYVILALVALQYAALGLCVSSYSNSIDGAVRWTYGLVLCLSVLSLGPHQFFQGEGGDVEVARNANGVFALGPHQFFQAYLEGPFAVLGEWLRCLSPYAALMSLLGAGDLTGQGLLSTDDLPQRFAVASLAITVLCSIATILRLNHRIFDQSRAAGQISDDRSAAVRTARRIFFLVDPQRRSRGIGPFVNPVMVKEFRCRRFGRLHWLLRLVSACAIMSLLLTYATTQETFEWGVETIGGIMVFLQVALLVLITPSLAAGLISGERESGGWTMLITTPMSVWRIVWGKLQSVVLTLLLVLCATLPGYLVMVFIEPGMRFQVERVAVCLLATAAFCMLVSAAVGSLFRRTAPATAAAYSALLAVFALPLLVWMGRDAPFGRGTVESALVVNPIAAALSVIRAPGFQDYHLIPGNWWFLGVSSALALLMLVMQTWKLSRPQ
ncbi:MAG TPA: ABC transporter permease subunit [Planctomycetaceae bacterium]|jgi:ABC-type transport system involved in multi-copper enzyme maturation permease subunit|nr:ABC transporter permease subunit [Planctomycetaceae bacterium]